MNRHWLGYITACHMGLLFFFFFFLLLDSVYKCGQHVTFKLQKVDNWGPPKATFSFVSRNKLYHKWGPTAENSLVMLALSTNTFLLFVTGCYDVEIFIKNSWFIYLFILKYVILLLVWYIVIVNLLYCLFLDECDVTFDRFVRRSWCFCECNGRSCWHKEYLQTNIYTRFSLITVIIIIAVIWNIRVCFCFCFLNLNILWRKTQALVYTINSYWLIAIQNA